MTQATPYVKSTNFTQYASNNPAAPYQPASLDAELNNVSASVNVLANNLNLIQRDDGKLADATVTAQSFDTSALLMIGGQSKFKSRGTWGVGISLNEGDFIRAGSNLYFVVTDHISSSIASDESANKIMLAGTIDVSETIYAASGDGVDFTFDNLVSGIQPIDNEVMYVKFGAASTGLSDITLSRDGVTNIPIKQISNVGTLEPAYLQIGKVTQLAYNLAGNHWQVINPSYKNYVIGSILDARVTQSELSAYIATFSARYASIPSQNGETSLSVQNVSASIDLGLTGEGGIDTLTHSFVEGGFVYVYLIGKPDGTTALLAAHPSSSKTESYTGANMPSGYGYSQLVAVLPTHVELGAPYFIEEFTVLGRKVYFNDAQSGNLLLDTGISGVPTTDTSLTGANFDRLIPEAAKELHFTGGTSATSRAVHFTLRSGVARAFISGSSQTTALDGLALSVSASLTLTRPPTLNYKSVSATSPITIRVEGYTF